MNTWPTYVRTVIGDTKHRAVASRLGIHFSTLSGWLHGRYTPPAETVIEFARAYDLNRTEALVAAGYLSADEADLTEATVTDPSTLPLDVLLAEIGRRTGERVA